MDTIEALIALHQAERQVFRRMVDMGVDAKKARNIMAFWMWLESEGGIKELVKKISSHNDKVLGLVGLEAEVALASIQADAATPNASTIRVPVTLNLANGLDSFSLKNVLQDREKVSHGVSHIFDGVCGMIFEDILEERSKGNAKEGNRVAIAEIVQQWVKPIEVNSNGEGEDGDKSEVLSPFGSILNPFAKEWQPASEEKRCLYLTFSNGFPLSELQILSFFTKLMNKGELSYYANQA
ncbi:hypothetical protein F0562_019056 [Nyssa sinensis]|uniref:Uncharacterized protein n=1 Tax=Nyssa sinensis TaxID=561372 RepID=A0A5J4ZF79_9ASTE|nr:hypothetical protein F0562_019056 [Nyssa sinensis]